MDNQTLALFLIAMGYASGASINWANYSASIIKIILAIVFLLVAVYVNRGGKKNGS